MGDKVHSINSQIEKFKERELDLSCYDEAKLKEILLDIGYYRLGFYCHYYFDKKANKFSSEVKISDIINVYYLDIDLKYLLLKYINRIEINFRTKLIYYISMKYKDNSRWYVDDTIMDSESIIAFKNNVYTQNFKQDNLTLKNHHINHPDDDFAPCWKVFEYLTFGAIITIFGNIKDQSVKQIIADKYGVRDLNKFFRFLHTVRQVRNICAHSGVLFDYTLPLSVNSIPQISYNKGDRNSLDASIKVIGFFVQTISENRFNDFNKDIKSFFDDRKKDPILAAVIRDHIKYLD
ncbi:MAG: Abi family protein [Bacteroidetes bacterium]|nr:Abi family protein [Bacteroidota bacterium]